MMNIYRHRFVCHCPNNSLPIVYELQIETTETIMVERITEECAKEKSAFHEKLADKFLSIFGGRQILKAHHHGVDIETLRPLDSPDCGRLTQRVQIGSTVYEKGVEAIHAIKAISRGSL